MDLTGRIIDYEDGTLEGQDVVDLFQDLIDSDLAWTLQGSYGRTAAQLIEAGHCHTADTDLIHDDLA